ncbi:IS3 family transposase [Paenibacillus gansuensis]|uniref:IS3 family transposase n=1 Tax=Paenibacillus gansuensis TaxID=306542 RepID=A0ABW5PHI3_9BACL
MESYWGRITFDQHRKDIDYYNIFFYNFERLQNKLNGLCPMEYRTKAA